MARTDRKPVPYKNKIVISCRIPPHLREALSRITDRRRDPLAPTVSQIVEHGITLAIAEFSNRLRR